MNRNTEQPASAATIGRNYTTEPTAATPSIMKALQSHRERIHRTPVRTSAVHRRTSRWMAVIGIAYMCLATGTHRSHEPRDRSNASRTSFPSTIIRHNTVTTSSAFIAGANAYVPSPLFSVRPSPAFSIASQTLRRLAWITNSSKAAGRGSRNTASVVKGVNGDTRSMRQNSLNHKRQRRRSSSQPINEKWARRFNLTTPEIDSSDSSEDGGDDDGSGSWLQWMRRGQRSRGAADIKMREAEELGGLPRSDRYSSSDWLHNTITLPNSKILSDISSPCVAITSWATFLSIVYRRLSVTHPTFAAKLALPVTPHSLTVSALSLLLVFKTNSAYQRFAEGRKIWESIVNTSRDLYRLCILYETEIGKAKRRRLQRLLAAFPYLLRHRIRPNLVMYRLDDEQNVRDPENSILLYQDRAANDLDPELAAVAEKEENEGSSRRRKRALFWVDRRTLPWRLLPPDALEQCASAQNRPLWVCDRMAQELRRVPDGPNFAARERLTLISKVEKLSGCIGACERIHQTAVPLNYARHSLRALTLWLFTLPFSLVGTLGLCTGPVLFLISWLMFGVYQIGYSIEDPFQGTLRLSVLCDAIRRDVLADEVVRNTAFELVPPRDVAQTETEDTNDINSASAEAVDDDSDDDDAAFDSLDLPRITTAVVVQNLLDATQSNTSGAITGGTQDGVHGDAGSEAAHGQKGGGMTGDLNATIDKQQGTSSGTSTMASESSGNNSQSESNDGRSVITGMNSTTNNCSSNQSSKKIDDWEHLRPKEPRGQEREDSRNSSNSGYSDDLAGKRP